MNGCLLFTVMIYLLHWQLGERSKPLLQAGFWRVMLKCLATRDYLFRTAPALSVMDEAIKGRLSLELKRGTLRIKDMEDLGEFYSTSLKQQAELKGLLGTYVTHLGFVLLVPLAFRLLLTGQSSFERGDLLELSLALIGFLFITRLLLKAWPMPSLALPKMLQDFVGAYLGDRDCGPWAEDLKRLARSACLNGIDSRAEQRQLLKEWHWRTAAACEQRRIFLENCLGPAELLSTCYFGTCLVLRPLLSHFSHLVPGG